MTKEEWSKLSPYMQRALQNDGVFPDDLSPVPEKGQPVTNFGIINSPEQSMSLATGLEGITYRPEKPDLPTSDRSSLRIYSKNQMEKDPKAAFVTRAHEAEHALAGQGRGAGSAINAEWNNMVGKEGADRGYVVKRFVDNSDYLVKNWGLSPTDAKKGYFSNKIYENNSRPYNMLYEQLATISALEQQTGKRFVEDPYVRKNILKTPAEREAYEALTGLRQTRLDAKDLPPYTRQPGSTSTKSDPDNAGVLDKVKSMLGFEHGGAVQMPDEYSKGSWKLI